MDMKIPPLTLKIALESNPRKFRILVRRLAVVFGPGPPRAERQVTPRGDVR